MQGRNSMKRQVSNIRVRRFPGQDSVSLVSTVGVVLKIGHNAFLYFSIRVCNRLLHNLQWKQGLLEDRKVRKKRERR
jgi:hypothetical protein